MRDELVKLNEDIKRLENEWTLLTRELKDMSGADPKYGSVWNERIEVGKKLKEARKRKQAY